MQGYGRSARLIRKLFQQALSFIASGIADTTLEDISYNALPFVFVTVGVIILCVFVPDIVLFLPRMMY